MKALNTAKFIFPAKSSNEGFARGAIAAFVAQCDPSLDELADIKTAVSEAVTNCIVHAYPETIGQIYITVSLYENYTVRIKVTDRGIGIADVANAMLPMVSSGGEERSGLGFTVMQTFMDTLKVRSAPGKGTTVTMEKKITQRSET